MEKFFDRWLPAIGLLFICSIFVIVGEYESRKTKPKQIDTVSRDLYRGEELRTHKLVPVYIQHNADMYQPGDTVVIDSTNHIVTYNGPDSVRIIRYIGVRDMPEL